ncbi:class I SAM-dependent methyltransferase [Sphingomonas sp. dw_22]|uniref:class I SAM-dependent methyltransferase n=1 Tax=Sphingomonas sp. dw_22 TaxID=2721175 RepID=UPI001BD3B2FB|nr:class I SAM-dependent methyltransferase [Sphingomonas sp. dw_22]
MTFGSFIEPDKEAQDIQNLAEQMGITIYSGYRALREAQSFAGENRIFDRIVERLKGLNLQYEDQCSSRYYFDVVRTLRDLNGQFDRVVEVGVFMGGATSFLTGCIEPFDFDLDLVDVHPAFLRFAYERVRRMYPESAKRIRLFHGDLPSYVRHVLMHEQDHRYVIHHDGSHSFDQVVKDMASLYYVQKSIFAVIAQDTHLRGTAKHMNFVDMALYAVFGTDLKYAPIGSSYPEHHGLTTPNQYQGNYFMPNAPEGIVLPMAANSFRYPHPALPIDDFLPPELPAAAAPAQAASWNCNAASRA